MIPAVCIDKYTRLKFRASEKEGTKETFYLIRAYMVGQIGVRAQRQGYAFFSRNAKMNYLLLFREHIFMLIKALKSCKNFFRLNFFKHDC